MLRLIDHGIFATFLVWLFFCSEALLPLLMTAGGEAELSNSQRNIIQNITKLFIVFSIFLFIYNFKGIIFIFSKNILFLLIIILSWLSYLWSIDPDITFRRCLIFTSFSVVLCSIVLQYDLKKIIKLILYLNIIVVILSIFLMIFDPYLGFNLDGRGARGVFVHKNVFSEFLLVTIIAVMVAVRMRLLPTMIGYPYLLVYAALLVMTNSATAWVVAVLMVGIYAVTELKRLPFKVFACLVAFGTAFTILFVSLTVFNLDSFFLALNRDPTLTGRDAVWAYVGLMIQERFFFGYGYAAFWESERILSYVVASLNWHITHAHNGFLQVWIELGLVGFCLTILYFLQCMLRFFLSKPSQELRAFLLPTLIGLIIYNLGETQLLISKNIGWLIILICLFLTTPKLDEIRRRFSRDYQLPGKEHVPIAIDAAVATNDGPANAGRLPENDGELDPRSIRQTEDHRREDP